MYYWLLYVNVLLSMTGLWYTWFSQLCHVYQVLVQQTVLVTSCFERLTPNDCDKKLFDTLRHFFLTF